MRRAPVAGLLLLLALSGCVGDDCQRFESYPYADLHLTALPSDEDLDRALSQHGWTVLSGANGTARATRALPSGELVQLRVGIPETRASPLGTTGLFLSAGEARVRTDDDARALLAPVVEPLSDALGGGPVVYFGGVEHCGEI